MVAHGGESPTRKANAGGGMRECSRSRQLKNKKYEKNCFSIDAKECVNNNLVF
jgi:hypothetical protein